MSSSVIRSRIRYIDFLKAAAMILVILGHINFANEGIKAWIYAFHMPVFFFASGLLLRPERFREFSSARTYIFKKAKGLLIPYFIWALIYAPLSVESIIKILYGSHQMLGRADSLTSLWFLPVLFLAIAILVLLSLILKQKLNILVKVVLICFFLMVAALLPKISSGYPWGINIVFCALSFLLLGNLSYPLIEIVRRKIGGKTICLFALAAVIILSFVGTLLFHMNIPEEGYVNMSNAVYGNFFLFFITACFGICFTVSISIFLDILLSSWPAKALSWFGENTLAVFCVHKPIIGVFHKLFQTILVPAFISLIVTCIGTVLISCLVASFLNHFIPFIVGKADRN